MKNSILFEFFRKGCVKTFQMEYNMWDHCRKLLEIPDNIFVDDGLWGRRGNGSLNTTSIYTYKQPNPYYIPSTQLKNSSEIMRKIILAQRKVLAPSKNGQLCVFLVSSQIQFHNRVNKPGLHTNVLVAKLNNNGTITCKFINL